MYSVQFELGPFSEASIGNVGLRPNTTGWVDHVVTPAGALGIMVAEDALDRYLIVVRIESWTENRVVRAIARMVFNPGRTLSKGAHRRSAMSVSMNFSRNSAGPLNYSRGGWPGLGAHAVGGSRRRFAMRRDCSDPEAVARRPRPGQLARQ